MALCLFGLAFGALPTPNPTAKPTSPTGQPSGSPTRQPSTQPSSSPTGQPTGQPTSPTGSPTGTPTSAPSYTKEAWGQVVTDKKRHRMGGLCENHCSNHGTCEMNSNCKCFTGLSGEPEWTGPDCSQRVCPKDYAWIGSVVGANNVHSWEECSNKGVCDRKTGACACFPGYDGVACQRTLCPQNCNDRGTCWPEKHLAAKASRVYSAPWDAMKHVGCFCDAGYRGEHTKLFFSPSFFRLSSFFSFVSLCPPRRSLTRPSPLHFLPCTIKTTRPCMRAPRMPLRRGSPRRLRQRSRT